MEPSDLVELRTMYVFSPADGETWGLTFDGFRSHLLARNPDEFLRLDEGRAGPVRRASLHFGITFDDEVLEGFAALTPEGVAIRDCTAHAAANFVLWLREVVVPQDKAITFNTDWGIEGQIADSPVPDVTRPRLVAAFLAHLETLGLD
ncbi:hypothetical protein [Streptomyces virginiae]|uniref:hypothetical protein n=1 Tax=Streptomyces virginiae TaxID=1961 RepID=UPI0022587F37|nr:hypothetical protein [Streptomyces virginiae]MCX4958096.1 hypothetical protein [Streptomyces virginiae]MCX5176925.1 hypothetical protein [Streptomyces virginiae]